MLIKNKDQMFALLRLGMLGNTVASWRTKEEVFASNFRGNVYIRYLGNVGGGLFVEDLPVAQIAERVRTEVGEGWLEEKMYFGEWIPVDQIVMNCYLLKQDGTFHLFYSYDKSPMRESLERAGQHISGYRALLLPLSQLGLEDQERLCQLLDLYEGCVVEFTIYERSKGTLGWCFIVWEVRYY